MVVISAVVLLFVLMFLNVPVYTSLIASALDYFINSDVNTIILVQKMARGLSSTTLLAIPFFICAGILMNSSGIADRLFDFCKVILGRMPGALAQVNVLLSTLMGGMSGSNIADAAMQSKMVFPQMIKGGYDAPFSAAVTAASSLITPIIPPGIGLITFGYLGNVSVGRLFMAGILPGVLMCVVMMIFVHFISLKNGYLPIRKTKATMREIGHASKSAISAIVMPVIIIGGIRLGIFSATEAGSVAIVYAIVVGFLFYKSLTVKSLVQALRDTVVSTTNVAIIFASATAFSWFITNERIPQAISDWVITSINNPTIFLLAVIGLLLICGCFMDGGALQVILVPLLLPAARALGINEVHFGIIYILTSAIGTLTPPLGTVMFTVCNITGVGTRDFVKAEIPFYICLIICLLILAFVPQITLLLPNLVYGV